MDWNKVHIRALLDIKSQIIDGRGLKAVLLQWIKLKGAISTLDNRENCHASSISTLHWGPVGL